MTTPDLSLRADQESALSFDQMDENFRRCNQQNSKHTIYVAEDGDDTNTGLIANSPTLNVAAAVALAASLQQNNENVSIAFVGSYTTTSVLTEALEVFSNCSLLGYTTEYNQTTGTAFVQKSNSVTAFHRLRIIGEFGVGIRVAEASDVFSDINYLTVEGNSGIGITLSDTVSALDLRPVSLLVGGESAQGYNANTANSEYSIRGETISLFGSNSIGISLEGTNNTVTVATAVIKRVGPVSASDTTKGVVIRGSGNYRINTPSIEANTAIDAEGENLFVFYAGSILDGDLRVGAGASFRCTNILVTGDVILEEGGAIDGIINGVGYGDFAKKIISFTKGGGQTIPISGSGGVPQTIIDIIAVENNAAVFEVNEATGLITLIEPNVTNAWFNVAGTVDAATSGNNQRIVEVSLVRNGSDVVHAWSSLLRRLNNLSASLPLSSVRFQASTGDVFSFTVIASGTNVTLSRNESSITITKD